MLAATTWCPACVTTDAAWGPGPGGRPDASCRHCGSLERHRIAAIVLDLLDPLLRTGLVVEAAPTPAIRRLLLERVGRERYLGFDIGLDTREIDLYADVTRLPFADRSLHALVCFHVLEHVPDDRTAMAELARVVADGGVVIVNNPWRRHGETDEDPSAPVEERVRRFGQADHVRWYGVDFEDRLREAGLHVQRFEAHVHLPLDVVVAANLDTVPIWLLTREGVAGEDARGRITSLLSSPSESPLLRATRPAPIIWTGADEPRLRSAARAAGVEPVVEGDLARTWAGLVSGHRSSTGAARRAALLALAGIEDDVRRSLGIEPEAPWGIVAPALVDDPATVRTLLSWLPRARVVLAGGSHRAPAAIDELLWTTAPGQVATVADTA